MNWKALLAGAALLGVGLGSAPAAAQASSDYARLAGAELRAGHLTTARRLSLEAVFRAEDWEGRKTVPACGEWRGTGTVQHVAFLPGDALRVMVVREAAISAYDLSRGRVERRWRANLALPGEPRSRSMIPENPVAKQFAGPVGGRLRVVGGCSVQPKIPGPMTQFVYSAPPGYLDAGLLSSSGRFLAKTSFQTDVDGPETTYRGLKLMYARWITDQP